MAATDRTSASAAQTARIGNFHARPAGHRRSSR